MELRSWFFVTFPQILYRKCGWKIFFHQAKNLATPACSPTDSGLFGTLESKKNRKLGKLAYWSLRESVAYPVLISAATPPTPPRNSAGGRALNRAFDFFGGYFAGWRIFLNNSHKLLNYFKNVWHKGRAPNSYRYHMSSNPTQVWVFTIFFICFTSFISPTYFLFFYFIFLQQLHSFNPTPFNTTHTFFSHITFHVPQTCSGYPFLTNFSTQPISLVLQIWGGIRVIIPL